MFHHDGSMFGMGWFWLLVLVLIIGAIWVAMRTGPRRRGEEPRMPSGRTPEDVLRERFARGEIDADEYQARMRTLKERP